MSVNNRLAEHANPVFQSCDISTDLQSNTISSNKNRFAHKSIKSFDVSIIFLQKLKWRQACEVIHGARQAVEKKNGQAMGLYH